MTPAAEALVKESWGRISGREDDLARAFYARLFEIGPAQAKLFGATDMTAQRRKFTDMLGEIVRTLDHPDALIPEAKALAERHVVYGVQTRDYPLVGDALVHAIGAVLGDDFTPALRAAWEEAYAYASSVMIRVHGRA